MSEPPALEGLLGPPDPEISCEQCFEQLDAYVEAELGLAGFERCPACVSPGRCGAERHCLGMRAHLTGCPACAEEHASMVALLAGPGR
jgi:hypothetical protein